MTEIKQLVLDLLGAAKVDGPSISPSKLLDVIEGFDNPISAIGEWDSSNAIFGALHEEFDFMRVAGTAQNQLKAESRATWIALFRWFIHGLETWRVEADLRYHRLVALLAYAQYCNFGTEEWAELPDRIGHHNELCGTLVRLHAGFRPGFHLFEAHRARRLEREAVERLERAERDNDWLVVSESWGRFHNAMFANAFHIQLVRCLCRFDFEGLVDASERIDSFQTAMVVAQALSLRERFRVGVRTGNVKTRFAAVFQTFDEHPRALNINEEAQPLLADILRQVALDESEWKHWMSVYNRFPLRYPAMQSALGKALAFASDAAIRIYVESFHMFPGGVNSRTHVAVCLQAFSDEASPDRRKFMWSCAHRRWSEWNFGVADNPHMFDITSSDLDYAIVAYCLECLNAQARIEEESALLRDLASVQDRWHSSITDCLSERNRLLSRLQPYARANAVLTGEKGYVVDQQYAPDFSWNRYSKMMFGLG